MMGLFKKIEPHIPNGDFTWDSLMGVPVIQDIVNELVKTQKYEDALTVAQVIFHCYAFFKGTGRIYEVSDSIAEMLLNTELNVDVSLVKSPFRETMIIVPENLVQIYNRTTGMHNVYTIYTNLEERSDTDKTLKVLCIGRENSESKELFDDAVFYFKIDFKEGTISESLKQGIEEWKKNPNYELLSTMNDSEIMPRLFQFTLNILLYITSADCDIVEEKSQYTEMEKRLKNIQNSAKIRKLQQKIDRESRINRYVIGRSIKLSSEEVQLYEAIRSGKHKVRYPVGGHFRLQWYGHKDSQYQKHKWIRPHFRGPEIAELIRSIGVIK
jgi:hypothetical protein